MPKLQNWGPPVECLEGIKSNGKLYHILVDTGRALFTSPGRCDVILEHQQKPAKDKNFYKAWLSWISVELSWERKVKFHVVLLFPKDWFCFGGIPWLLIFSLLGAAISFLFVSFCVLRIWLGFLPAWGLQLLVGSCVWRQLRPHVLGPKIKLKRNGVTFYLWLGLYLLLSALRETV